jgi:hypothetical protein
MSNPTITRLGKTQMWYKNYYTDFSFKNNFNQINSFESLVNTFFIYGLYTYSNLNYKHLWYRNSSITNFKLPNKFHLYFRKFFYAHTTLTIEHSYFTRIRTPEFFPLRLYILKYNNWLVISLQWFKPSKVLKSRAKNFSKSARNISHPAIIPSNKVSYSRNRRIILTLTILTKSLKTVNLLKYNF